MKNKKLIALILSFALAMSSLAFSVINAFAETVTLTDAMFGIEIVKSTSGYDDNVWYVYTPSQSGVYTLYGLSSNIFSTEAYLFEKTEDENGKKLYTQLAYSNSNPNYANYEGSAKRQFCLQYHLVKGETYYYAAGWNDPNQGNRTLAVAFINESTDSAELVKITPSCDAELTWYTDGSWETDDSGNAYYLYNISKIMQNMVVTLEFDDGTTITSQKGSTDAGGYPISYTHKQQSVHWYNSENENYTANTLTVSVMGKSADYEVVINQSALLTYSGKVVDSYDNAPVSNAKIVIGSNTVATTKSDGTFQFSYSPGKYTAIVTGSGIVKREYTVNIDAVNVSGNNHTDEPVEVVTGDYIDDDIINGRDYAYIKTNLTGDDLTDAKARFTKNVGFVKSDYEKLIL